MEELVSFVVIVVIVSALCVHSCNTSAKSANKKNACIRVCSPQIGKCIAPPGMEKVCMCWDGNVYKPKVEEDK